ncbi:MAG: sulfur carrier protein ThiS adenylyltransferase ThiF [Deltaproteobacteria bacterium]|nr:sulfur carrier protein ThiS adenylyltransferase ThiF [Deltaproteobacteria bacterium]
MITAWTQEHLARLAAVRIGVAGAGGLGSNAVMCLARAGVRHLVVVDPDVVEADNLNRQAYTRAQVGRFKVDALAENVASAAPGCGLVTHRIRWAPGEAARLFEGCAVVLEALDEAGAKAGLIEDVLTHLPEAAIVCVSGLAGIGGNNALRTTGHGRLFVVGDGHTAPGPDVPLLAPRVVAAAALQANMALALALGDTETG